MSFSPALSDVGPLAPLRSRWAGGDGRRRTQARTSTTSVVRATARTTLADLPSDLGYRLSGWACKYGEAVAVAPGKPSYLFRFACFEQAIRMSTIHPIPVVWRHHDGQTIACPCNVHLSERKGGLWCVAWPTDNPIGQLVVSKLTAGERLAFSVSWWPVVSKNVGGVVVVTEAGLHHVALTPFPAASGCGVRCESPGQIVAEREAKRRGFPSCRL